MLLNYFMLIIFNLYQKIIYVYKKPKKQNKYMRLVFEQSY